MSNSSAHRPRVAASETLRAGRRRLAGSVQFVGFWLSVALPLAYLPLLFGGFTAEQAVAFVVLLVLHLLALIAGHGYRR